MERPAFRKRFFPGASAREWNDWRWQLRNRLRSRADFERILPLTDSERDALDRPEPRLPAAVTPYYAALLDPADPLQPLRRSVIPTIEEDRVAEGEYADPLGEESHSPVPGIIHTYPDKALLLATDSCACYCRFCTRSRAVGSGRFKPARDGWERALAYLAARPAIRDVLISGGEPLTLDDDKLAWLLSRLREIRHVEIIRIGSKAPVFLPQRITPALARLLRKFHPLWMSLHFTHPAELTPETRQACIRLADAGIPLCSQTVLLRGINDDPSTIKSLMLELLKCRVKPYYLHQCDAVAGASHFRTAIAQGREMVRKLHGYTSGLAVPAFMLDAPGGGGKVPLTPDYIVGWERQVVKVRNYRGKLHRYTDGP